MIACAIVGVLISGASYEAPPNGLPDAGAFVGWSLPIIKALVLVAQMATVGMLLLAGFLDPELGKTVVSRRGRTAMLKAAVAAGVWCLGTLFLATLVLSNILGITYSEVLDPAIFSTYAWEIVEVRTLLVTSLLGLAICIGCVFSISLSMVTVWLALTLVAVAAPATAGHAAGLGDHSMAVSNAVAHAVAASVWVGGLIALGTLVFSLAKPRSPKLVAVAAQRFGYLAMAAVIVLLISGILSAYVRLASVSDLWTSGYGRLVILKSALLVVLVVLAAQIRQRILPQLSDEPRLRTFSKVAVSELVLMGIASGLGVALTMTAPTRAEVLLPTQGEMLLGFAFPPPPTFANVALGWDFDILFFAIGVVACAYYTFWVCRLRARGDKWPWLRLISWYIGWGIVIWATNSGIATYSEVSVGLHMVQHMTLTMLAPIFIVLAAPITLALRALKPSPTGGRGPRELLMTGLHSPLARFITHPLVVLFIYVFGLYGLYLTDLFGALMASHVGHIFMTLHFLLSGLLLAYVVIGTDPKPKPLPYWGRMMLVMSAVVLHAFFAVAMMSTATVIGANWYSIVRPEWITDPVRDSVLGGQIAWGVGEIPGVVMLLIIAVQWLRSDKRESDRRDRRTRVRDTELEDYNAYLADLNKRAR